MISGKHAKEGTFTFMAALTWFAGGYESNCSGFVVSPTAIMAAAHCLHVSDDHILLQAHYTARIGSVDREEGGVVVQLLAIIHPLYHPATHDNDISILKPIDGKPFPLRELGVVPVALVMSDHMSPPERAWAMGWGRTDRKTCVSFDGRVSKMLLYHAQTIKTIGEKKMRVQGKQSSTCKGDSGSPLVFETDNGYAAIGLLSAGTEMGTESYTRIAAFESFIKEHAPDATFL